PGGDGPAAAAAVAVPALLAVQEERAAPRRESADAARRADAALVELTGLQLDLLRGRVGQDRLLRLARMAETTADDADPALRSILAEVALRVRVELARQRAAARGATASAI
ncbi:flagellar assembly protein FliX, partial [Falsiroseomonas oryzae]|uniref:flagellar assembly protein FliX n=1 Tax=Falsiroseomonas oryzae TaxID=2766473 RepID=UPI0022EAFB7F